MLYVGICGNCMWTSMSTVCAHAINIYLSVSVKTSTCFHTWEFYTIMHSKIKFGIDKNHKFECAIVHICEWHTHTHTHQSYNIPTHKATILTFINCSDYILLFFIIILCVKPPTHNINVNHLWGDICWNYDNDIFFGLPLFRLTNDTRPKCFIITFTLCLWHIS